MAVQLLRLPSGHCSLEMEPGDLDAVAAAITELFGAPAVEQRPTYLIYGFGGESFAFQNEWDEPCLVSSTARGSQMLVELARRLG